MQGQTIKDVQLAAVDLLIAVGGPLKTQTLRLFTNNIQVTRDVKLADLVEATFDGYAAVAGITFSSAYLDPQGNARTTGAGTVFEATGATVEEVVYGWYLTNAGGTTLSLLGLLPQPVPITQASDGVFVLPEYVYGN